MGFRYKARAVQTKSHVSLLQLLYWKCKAKRILPEYACEFRAGMITWKKEKCAPVSNCSSLWWKMPNLWIYRHTIFRDFSKFYTNFTQTSRKKFILFSSNSGIRHTYICRVQVINSSIILQTYQHTCILHYWRQTHPLEFCGIFPLKYRWTLLQHWPPFLRKFPWKSNHVREQTPGLLHVELRALPPGH